MRRMAMGLLALFLLIPVLFAQESEECHRPPTQELADYKETYIPQEFSHELFTWEIADILILAFLLAVGSLLSVRHHPKWQITLVTVSGLLYFGLFRGGCICPVGATTNFCIGLTAPELIGKTVAVIFLLPLITAFLFGRIFCSAACPLGAIQHLFSRTNGIQLPEKINRILNLLPIAVLIATAWGAVRSGIFLACKLDVYKPIFFTGHAWITQLTDWIKGTGTESGLILVGDWIMWTTLAAVLITGIFIPRPFCRFACPYGVLLGFFSKIGLRKRRIDAESCFNCIMCTRTCPVQAISADKDNRTVSVNDYRCIQCGRCDVTCTTDSFQSPSPYPDTRFPNIGKN